MEVGSGCYAAKSDMSSAFRNLPIRKEDWKWLLMMAEHPVSGVKYFFFQQVPPIWGKYILLSFPEIFKQCCSHMSLENWKMH